MADKKICVSTWIDEKEYHKFYTDTVRKGMSISERAREIILKANEIEDMKVAERSQENHSSERLATERQLEYIKALSKQTGEKIVLDENLTISEADALIKRLSALRDERAERGEVNE